MPPVLVVPDLTPSLAGARQPVATSLPPLPALSALLRSGSQRMADADWRTGLLLDLGVPRPQISAPAVIGAHAATLLAPAAGVCVVTPVHAVVGISRVHLPAAGVLTLDDAQRAQLLQAFEAQFGSADARLHAVGRGILLEAPYAQAADDADPMTLEGTALARAPAQSAAQRALRRLGAETEMWLASLPLNQERARRGEPVINSLWFWGGGVVGETTLALPQSIGLFGTRPADPWLAGLGSRLAAPLQICSGWQALPRAESAVVVLQPETALDASQLQQWDDNWFAPALQALQERRITALQLRLGRRALQLRRRSVSMLWRRPQPWWRVVQSMSAAQA